MWRSFLREGTSFRKSDKTQGEKHIFSLLDLRADLVVGVRSEEGFAEAAPKPKS